MARVSRHPSRGWQDCAVTRTGSQPRDVAHLVQHMFADVFTEDERAGLLAQITAWDAEHPDASPADRISAWIDIAYEYQSASRPEPQSRVAPSVVIA